MATTINNIDTLKKELDKKYPYSTDKTNYGQLLSGVASRTKVHDVIKDIVTIACETAKTPYFMSECKQLLYGYMNECIANLYEKGGRTSLDGFCEAWINIRAHENKNTIRERIEEIAKSRGLDVEKTKNDIQKTFEEFEYNYKQLNQFTYKSNGYNQYLPLSKKGASLLLKYKFDPYGLPYKLGWSNIFTEVEKDEREKEAKEAEEKKKEKEKNIENISIVIGVVVFIAIIVGLSIWLESVEGAIILIIIIAAIIKLYAGLFKH